VEEYHKDLGAERVELMMDGLSAQVSRAFDQLVETDKRLTQHNFLVNAGGSAAVLGYMGTQSASSFLVLPLICFLVGVIFSGLEIRALLKFYSLLHVDALRQRSGFSENQLRVRELMVPPHLGKWTVRMNHSCGWISQLCFVFGVAIGLLVYFCSRM
jgi:hypothetical protein